MYPQNCRCQWGFGGFRAPILPSQDVQKILGYPLDFFAISSFPEFLRFRSKLEGQLKTSSNLAPKKHPKYYENSECSPPVERQFLGDAPLRLASVPDQRPAYTGSGERGFAS